MIWGIQFPSVEDRRHSALLQWKTGSIQHSSSIRQEASSTPPVASRRHSSLPFCFPCLKLPPLTFYGHQIQLGPATIKCSHGLKILHCGLILTRQMPKPVYLDNIAFIMGHAKTATPVSQHVIWGVCSWLQVQDTETTSYKFLWDLVSLFVYGYREFQLCLKPI